MKKIVSLMLAVAVIFAAVDPADAAIKKKKSRAARLHKKKTEKYKYDFKDINKSPFSFHDLGMSEAEFFITDRADSEIQDEIDRIQGSLSELEYTTLISYEPHYSNQRPQTKSQKKSYLKGYLKVLEEAIL